MITVLGKVTSINVRKVLWCCTELGLPFQQENWGGDFQTTQTPEFLALNPHGLVPVIRDGDFVLWESNSILRYLANRYGADPLYPQEPRRRAQVDQWMDWQASDLNSAWRYAFMALVRKSPAHQQPTELAAAVAGWNAHMGRLDRHLDATDAYVAGQDFTLADITIALSVNRWLSTPMERPDYPAVASYFERLRERPGFGAHCDNGAP